MRVLSILLAFLFGLVAVSAQVTYNCDSPSTFLCFPGPSAAGGWTANGGGSHVTDFMPNNQCANVIPLGNGYSRLFCCYTPCGAFYQDVPYPTCVKTSTSSFTCRSG